MTVLAESEVEENKQKSKTGRQAVRRLSQPVTGKIRIGQLFVVFSALLSVAPYLALVELGRLFLAGLSAGVYDVNAIWRVVFVLTGAYSLKLLCYFIALTMSHLADLELRSSLRSQLVAVFSEVPLSWLSGKSSGAIRKSVQDDTSNVHLAIAHAPIDKLNAIFTPLALLLLAFYLDWRLGLLSIATLPVYFFVYSLTMRGLPENTAKMSTLLEKVSATMVEFVAGITVVKAFGKVGKAHGNYTSAADKFSKFYLGWSLPLVSTSALANIWISIPVLLLVNLSGGALLMNAGYVDLPTVLVSTLIALVLPGTVQTVAAISWQYELAGSAAIRICEVLDSPVLPRPKEGKAPNGNRVEIKNVSFYYRDTKALDGVSLTLEPKSVTALIGPSGSGKSTLATLIPRFSDPDEGSILIGGVDLRDMAEDKLYEKVSFVLQDAQLLHTSLRNNIALGKPEADLSEIRAAAEAAQIDKFIMSLPKQYDTIFGTDTKLSGGQEQRVAIARALLMDTPILILDEATAFADPDSEAEIQKALDILIKGKTVLVIAHRPSSIQGASQIAVMENGKIIAQGTHQELRNETHYAALRRLSGEQEDQS